MDAVLAEIKTRNADLIALLNDPHRWKEVGSVKKGVLELDRQDPLCIARREIGNGEEATHFKEIPAAMADRARAIVEMLEVRLHLIGVRGYANYIVIDPRFHHAGEPALGRFLDY